MYDVYRNEVKKEGNSRTATVTGDEEEDLSFFKVIDIVKSYFSNEDKK